MAASQSKPPRADAFGNDFVRLHIHHFLLREVRDQVIDKHFMAAVVRVIDAVGQQRDIRDSLGIEVLPANAHATRTDDHVREISVRGIAKHGHEAYRDPKLSAIGEHQHDPPIRPVQVNGLGVRHVLTKPSAALACRGDSRSDPGVARAASVGRLADAFVRPRSMLRLHILPLLYNTMQHR